jgi:MIP family channel proteins
LRSLREQLAAEFIGTFALVFIGAGSVVLSGPSGSGTIGVAVAHGLVLAIMISALGHISGGHFNPAVTVGVWVTGRIQTLRAGTYVVTQLVAAAAAAGLLRLTLTSAIWKSTNLGATLINTTAKGPQVGFTSAKALMLEAVLTFFLVIAVFGTAIDPRGAFKAIAGFGIGLVLTADILVGGVLTGASMNPARSFGPALVAGKWTDFWVYVLGPLAGGIIAAEVYWFFFLRGREDEDSDPDAPPGDEPSDDASEMEPAGLDS